MNKIDLNKIVEVVVFNSFFISELKKKVDENDESTINMIKENPNTAPELTLYLIEHMAKKKNQ